ncbi:MAG: anti-sigma F factor [Clostridiales bacterium]|jgi:stage II sporulation protein AB (anti-sigma F factor)|nr:anti-sigma F factor [Clostridiales bacterium]HOJ35292.1 anti-sigma F factor [Clostridiales bacterium]HOL79018.1 anti-sigma F factor [Clostridiales bacterium]HPU66897.1 anti-sigma F factor [Clostridiales bacterium]HQA06159.1 anti-sigma F factor [Clostridiales bacterium]
MQVINEMKMVIDALSINEGYCRVAVATFVAQLDPTIDELNDIKTSVSEAVTNCIVHAYPKKKGKIYITVRLYADGLARVIIKDKGIGIEDIKKAREPLFTTAGGERSGLGFSVMESFSDRLLVRSKPGRGTSITLEKRIVGKGK